jgi:hypothetical protein
MTTFDTQHPRVSDGTFTEKAQSAPDILPFAGIVNEVLAIRQDEYDPENYTATGSRGTVTFRADEDATADDLLGAGADAYSEDELGELGLATVTPIAPAPTLTAAEGRLASAFEGRRTANATVTAAATEVILEKVREAYPTAAAIIPYFHLFSEDDTFRPARINDESGDALWRMTDKAEAGLPGKPIDLEHLLAAAGYDRNGMFVIPKLTAATGS